jgi:hypothetical protein
MAASRNAKHAFKDAEKLRMKDGKARRKKEMEGDARMRMNISIEKLMVALFFSIEAAAAAAGAHGANDDSIMQVDSPLQQEQELSPGNQCSIS